MKIIVWKAEPDAPTSHAYLARFLTDKGFLPVFCTAKTEVEVRAKAQAFWDAETTKAAGRKIGKPRTTTDAIIERMGKPDPVEKGVCSDDAPELRYFYHPESDCLMATADGSRPGTDGLVEEIDAAEYNRIKAQQAAALETASLTINEDTDLGDLLA